MRNTRQIADAVADRRLVLHTDYGVYVTTRIGALVWTAPEPGTETEEYAQLDEWLRDNEENAIRLP